MELDTHLSEVLLPNAYKSTIKRILTLLEPVKSDFEGIVCSGLSGAAVAPCIAAELDKFCIFIRKNTDQSKGGRRIEGAKVNSYILLDDFLESGKTVLYMLNEMKKAGTKPAVCRYICFYSKYHTLPFDQLYGIRVLR